MEPEGKILCSQESAADLYPKRMNIVHPKISLFMQLCAASVQVFKPDL
jgi:hypothetical protein